MSEKYQLGPLLLDAEAHAVTYEGRPVALGQRAVAVLIVLVRAAGKYVSRTQILEAAWPGICVEEGNLSVQISAIRRALSIVPRGDTWLETLSRRGYRFVGPVTALSNKREVDATTRLRTNLTEPLTSFVGREAEQVVIRNLLFGHRLVTLTGAGGIGKTRLALRVAAQLLDVHKHGVWLVEFAPLHEPDLVARTATAIFGLEEHSRKSPAQVLVEYLQTKDLLLVLDNAEHILAPIAQLADDLTRQCPQVTILVTSRERLAVPGEVIYRVPSLSVPQSHRPLDVKALAPYESVQLLRQRTQLVLPHFDITDRDAPAIASICERLDGIPLALELAAARMRSMSVEEVNGRLDQRFRLLTGGSRTAPRRHQTLLAAVEWSYDLLNAPEKKLFDRLSVFSGGWTLEAAEHVCSGDGIEPWEVLDLLTSLTDKNLVVAEERLGHTRFRLLETLRQFAWDRLAERDGVGRWRDRHLAFFLELATRAEPQLRGPDQQAWLNRLDAEHDNFRSALRSSSDRPQGIELVAAFWPFWLMRGHFHEGRAWLSAFLAGASPEQALQARARVLRGSGVMAELEGDYRAARASYEQSIAIFRQLNDRRGIASALHNLGSVASATGDDETARALWEETLAIRRELSDALGTADVLGNLGKVAYQRGDFAAARAKWTESLQISRDLNDRRGVSFSLSNLGRVALDTGDLAAARAYWEESRTIAQELGDRWGYAWSLMNLGDLAQDQKDYRAAVTLHQESLSIRRELGNPPTIADSLERLACVAAALKAPLRAAQIWGAVERLREDIGVPLSPSERARNDRLVDSTCEASEHAAFNSAWEKGRGMKLEQAIAFALDPAGEP